MDDKETVEALKQAIGEDSITSVSYPHDRRVFIEMSLLRVKDAIVFLKKNGFTHLSAISGSLTDNKFIEILYHLDRAGSLITLRVVLPENECSIPTISDLIPGALLYEREIHDLYGVNFAGHPSLQKLVLPDEWSDQSFPLRN